MKKFLLATAAVLMSTSAYAADYGVVHPFYTPSKGKVESETKFRYVHFFYQSKNGITGKGVQISKEFTEDVTYGLTDDIQIGLTGYKEWKRANRTGWARDWKWYDTDWSINAGYNIINDGKAFLNASLTYAQLVEKDKPVPPTGDAHAKTIGLELFGGYNFDEVTVFGSIGYDRQVDGEKGVEKSKVYSLEAGVFKAFNDQISAKASLSADIDETKNAEERSYWLNAGADYSISKKMAVGVNAGYLLDNDKDDLFPILPETHSAYKLGVDFTVEF